DVEDSKSRGSSSYSMPDTGGWVWWHFMLLTFLSHYLSCDCSFLALYSEGGERTTHKKCQEGSRHMPEPWPHQPHLGNCM
uniref:Uncharacterized protein n=1 Tax=Rhinopithecus roxellana TaxID=61622 RepID=A0A2K6NYJ0_RHIRO